MLLTPGEFRAVLAGVGDSVVKIQRITVAGQVQVGSQHPDLIRADAGRPLIVDLQSQAKRLLIRHPEIEQALTRRRSRFQLRVDLLHIRILPEQLQAFLQFVQVERRVGPTRQPIGDIAVAKPFVAVQRRSPTTRLQQFGCGRCRWWGPGPE